MAEKISVLVLHGYSQNGCIFSQHLDDLRKEVTDLDLVFIDAPHVLHPVDDRNCPSNLDLNESEADFETSKIQDPLLVLRGWWLPDYERLKGVGVAESLTVVRDILKTRKFKGILGFSQGAAFAAIVTALLEKPETYPPFLINGRPPHPPMKFCIAISGFKHTDPICNSLFSTSYSTPTLHVIGKNDVVVIEKETRELIAVASNSRVEEHSGGHFVPIRSSWRKFLVEYMRNPSADIASPSRTVYISMEKLVFGVETCLYA